MSRAARCGWFLLLLTAAGCTKEEDYLEVVGEQRAAWKEMADILATVKDEKSMAAAKATLDERKPQFAAISRKARALPKPSSEVLKRLEEDKSLFEATLRRLAKESERVSKLPGGEEFMEHLKSNSQGLMSAVQK